MDDYIDDDKFNVIENSLCSSQPDDIHGNYNITDEGIALVNSYKVLINKLKKDIYYKDIHSSDSDPESVRPLNDYIADLKKIRKEIRSYFDGVDSKIGAFFDAFNQYNGHDKDSVKLMILDYVDTALHCYPFVQ